MKIIRLTASDAKKTLMNELVRVYTSSLAVTEQKPRSALESMLENNNYYFYILSDQDKTLGFAIIYSPDYSDYCLLEYIAVDETYRSKGYGKKLLGDLIKKFDTRPMIIEVDSPFQSSEDHVTREKRLEFYKNLGSKYVEGLQYILPLEANGKPPEMLLLVCSGHYLHTVPKSKLLSWVTDIYSAVYGCSTEDLRINHMISRLPTEVSLIN